MPLLLFTAAMIKHNNTPHAAENCQYSQHISNFCTATSHSGMTLHPALLLTNHVATCCRRSANESARAGPRLATRRRRRRRRTVEGCSNSSISPKAPRIHTESNAQGCIWLSDWVWRGVFVFVAKMGTKRESVHAFSFCTCLCLLLEWYTESQKVKEKTCPESEPDT